MVIIQINKRTQISWTFQAPFFTVFAKSYCSNERPVSNTRIFRKVLPFWSWLFQQWLMKWCSDELLQLAIAKRRVFSCWTYRRKCIIFVCLFVYLLCKWVIFHSVMWLWGNDYHVGMEKFLSKSVSVWEEWGGYYRHPKMRRQFSSAQF